LVPPIKIYAIPSLSTTSAAPAIHNAKSLYKQFLHFLPSQYNVYQLYHHFLVPRASSPIPETYSDITVILPVKDNLSLTIILRRIFYTNILVYTFFIKNFYMLYSNVF
jgi:hypothetical protein